MSNYVQKFIISNLPKACCYKDAVMISDKQEKNNNKEKDAE